MSSEKTTHIFGLTGKLEASYNAGGVPAVATDGILLAEPAVMSADFAFDGGRGSNRGTTGLITRLGPSGRSGQLPVNIEFRGRGTAYAATDYASDLHVLMRISGHSAAYSAAPTPQWTFAPVSSGYASGVFDAYARGQKYPLTGVYADMAYEIEAGKIAMFSFPLMGLVSLPTDVALPSITYLTNEPPKAESCLITIGAFTPKWRKCGFAKNFGKSPRLDGGSAVAHAGFTPGKRAPQFKITVEAVDLVEFDPFTAFQNGTLFAISVPFGSTQYNRFTHSMAYAQLSAWPNETDDNGTALWELTFDLGCSTPVAEDDYTFVLN